jgi:hypothetical protein
LTSQDGVEVLGDEVEVTAPTEENGDRLQSLFSQERRRFWRLKMMWQGSKN